MELGKAGETLLDFSHYERHNSHFNNIKRKPQVLKFKTILETVA